MPGKSRKQYAGAMPHSYVNNSYREPSASAGSNVLGSVAGLARPVLNPTGGQRTRKLRSKHHSKHHSKHTKRCKCMKGGFYPSVMGSFLQNASRLTVAAAVSAYRMIANYTYKKGRK